MRTGGRASCAAAVTGRRSTRSARGHRGGSAPWWDRGPLRTPSELFNWEQKNDLGADALEHVFADCAAEQECNDAYPNLRQTFFDLLERLNANPVTVESTTPDGQPFTAALTGDRFVALLSTALQDAGGIAFVPLLIKGASDGDMNVLSLAASVLPVSGTGFQSAGLAMTVICNEEEPFVMPAEIDAQNQGVDPLIRHAFANPDIFGRVCPEWGSPAPAAVETAPVFSDVPALVLAGQYDPSNPPAWSQMAAAALSHNLSRIPRIRARDHRPAICTDGSPGVRDASHRRVH